MKIRSGLILLLMFFSLSNVVPLGAEGAVKTRKSGSEEPIEIVADRLDVYSERKMIVFSGNAVATQAGRTIKAERITIFYKDEKGPRGAKKSDGDKGAVERVEAEGLVTIKEGLRVVTGDAAVYEPESQKITVWGGAEMREEENVVKGEKIVVLLNENRGIVEGSQTNRVKATIYSTQQIQGGSREKR